MVKLESSKYTPSATDRVGAGGVEKWTFVAIKKGTTRISLKYVRPWEKDKPPVEEKTFLIKVR
jgi:predicted secreted protein